MAKRRRRRVHRGRRKKRGFATWSLGKKIGAIVGGTIATVLVVGIVAGAVFLSGKMDRLDTKTLDKSALEINNDVARKEGYLNVALFGVDTRDGNFEDGSRSDTIMIASLNQATGEVKLCSVYRDTLLQQSDGTYNKANAAYSFGGAEGAVAMLNKNLDMDISHYVTVDFNALVDVIDDLGGIELDLTDEEVYWTNGYCNETSKVTGHKLEELTHSGKQTLNGVQATSYCRIRYTQGDDYKRTERQRTVLEQIAKKAQKADLKTINKIINDVFDEVSTNFTLAEMLSYAKDFMSYKIGETTGFPFDLTTDTLGDIGSTVIPDGLADNVLQLHKFLYGSDVSYTPSSVVNTISDEIASKSSLNYGESTDDSQEYGVNYYDTSGYQQDADTSGTYSEDTSGTGYDTGTGGTTGYDEGTGTGTGGNIDYDTGTGGTTTDNTGTTGGYDMGTGDGLY